MHQTLIAGPVFEAADAPQLILFYALVSLPYLFLAIGVILLLRDSLRRQMHRSTIVVLGLGIIFAVFTWLLRGVI